jgi:hypothetical protein
MTAPTRVRSLSSSAALVDAGGTMWRLRSLVAMGHDAARIGSALCAPQTLVDQILRGDRQTVSLELCDLACQLWGAWWDKRPPERTDVERGQAALARQLAKQNDWCTPLGLDEDELDEPDYRPYARYRNATGTGTASAFRPAVGQPDVHLRTAQPVSTQP